MSRRSVRWITLAAMLLLGVSAVTVISAAPLAAPVPSAPAGLEPTPAAGETIHIVARGEMLRLIAQRYGVGTWELARYNGIADPNLIYTGQPLRIPPSGRPTPAPVVQGEVIIIQSPAQGITVTNPVTVTGLAVSPFEQTVVVAVLDGSGAQIGLAPGIIAGEYGQQGTFSVSVPFTAPANSQPGRIQVYTTSPRDGAIEHLSSVSVLLPGTDLDPLLGQLELAVNVKDYPRLRSLMGPTFALSVYRAESTTLAPAEVIARLRSTYMGPGEPRLDFSVDARALLAGRVTLSPDISHVVYSTGWGADRHDDAFLLIGTVAGQARWVGMIYVPQQQMDYRTTGRLTHG